MNQLEINNLSVEYYRNKTVISALRGVALSIRAGETIAIAGESGCGKSTLAMSVLKLIFPGQGKITAGEITFNGSDILKLDGPALRGIRGKEIAVVFQDPFSSLNPVLTIEEQLTESVVAHNPSVKRSELKTAAAQALKEVMFTDIERLLSSYPHQLSGGQRQRVVIAMAIINRPKILIADEPTTALDVTIQKEIMDLLDKLKKELNLTLILITHNLLLAKQRSERIAVMYAGEIVELNETRNVFSSPLHPYTRGLINSVPKLLGKTLPQALSGQPPDLSIVAPGCSFYPRCPDRMEICLKNRPPDFNTGGAQVKCFLYKG